MQIQMNTLWNLYSGHTLAQDQGMQVFPRYLLEVSPEWKLGWGLLINNQQIKYIFFYSVSESAAVIISSS